jgi:WD40 repeat protein
MPGVTATTEGRPAWRRALDDFPRAMSWSADGELVAFGSASGRVTVFRAADGEPGPSWVAHDGAVTALAFHPRSTRVLTAGEDRRTRIYDVGEEKTLALPSGVSGWTEALAWNPKGSKLAVALGRVARIFSETGEPLVDLPEVESTISALAWSADGAQVAVACYGGVRLFDAKTGKRTKTLDWKGSMLSLAWSPNGKVIACGCQDNSLHFWRLPAGKDSMMSGYPLKPKAIGWSHDSKLLASSGAAEATVWRFEGKGPEGTTPIELAAHEEPITTLEFAPLVSMLATGCRGGRLFLWSPSDSPRPMRVFRLRDRVAVMGWGLVPSKSALLLAGADASGEVAAWPMQ